MLGASHRHLFLLNHQWALTVKSQLRTQQRQLYCWTGSHFAKQLIRIIPDAADDTAQL
jgi:hypothetical protein